MNDSTNSDTNRKLLGFVWETCDVVTQLSYKRELFGILAGAVFALHQDLKIAMGVDLLAPDRSDPAIVSRLLEVSMALSKISDTHRDYLETLPADAKALTWISTAMRRDAANVWLVTVYAEMEGLDMVDAMRVGRASIWMALGMVEADLAAVAAEIFVGSFFTDVKCETVCLSDWPQLID